ncbi:MAG: SUMF1/EgtB/PvdO family nonheme iron enzyme [Verrucomicrobiae bacterium]|nr:SUMF1/EgtB/PvdO family nonheme iron enzyme [Verrucomicrobiae bacterium]
MTGSYRAVKIVRREDFEREKTFEREFEGIQHYEKVSQDHTGLVDVLHAGRNAKEGYYYYVMELADDVDSGAEIDETNYRPRTLASDLKQHRLRSVNECVAVGALLAEALGHLHANGLTHRDVKPSNIIFVKGVAKLADVGLVASSGQRTYVGTEGYVPPEGPGTSSADLYSLAMVLYEMGTGKDRLEFPELPTNMELPPTVNRDEWRALNGVICRAGAPDPRRRFESGEALAAALRRIVDPTPLPASSWKRKLAAVAAIILAAGLGAVGFSTYREFSTEPIPPPPAATTVVEASPPTTSDSQPSETSNTENPSSTSGDLTGPEIGEIGTAAENLPNAFEIASLTPRFFGNSSNSGGSVSNDGVMTNAQDGRGVIISDLPIGPPPPPVEPPEPTPPPKALLKITQPTGASVWLGEEQIAVTPTDYLEFTPGPVSLVLKAPGYHDYELTRDLSGNRRQIESEIQMIPDRGPIEGQPWTNSLGVAFIPAGKRHISRDAIGRDIFTQFLEETRYPFSLATPVDGNDPKFDSLAFADDTAMWAFCDWMTARDRADGFLGAERFHHPQRDAGDAMSFFSRTDDRYGSIAINSEPVGAAVYRDERFLGRTPLTLEDERIGMVHLNLKMAGYRDTPVDLEVLSSDLTPVTLTMTRDDSVLFTEPFTNSLGMTFVPVGNFMASVFETRVKDYAQFLATNPEGVEPPFIDFEQEPDHPVAGINLPEARAFCAWLTLRERKEGLIQDYQEYRIPTDSQWSAMAGLTGETGDTPEIRDVRKVSGHFPWGTEWPPPAGSGNFADITAGRTVSGIIAGYNDTFEKTAPVGSFDPNPYEIHDLAGNVWEWIDEPFSGPDTPLYFLRGGGWASSQESELLTSYRKALRPEYKRGGGGEHGFRCVLVDTRTTQ